MLRLGTVLASSGLTVLSDYRHNLDQRKTFSDNNGKLLFDPKVASSGKNRSYKNWSYELDQTRRVPTKLWIGASVTTLTPEGFSCVYIDHVRDTWIICLRGVQNYPRPPHKRQKTFIEEEKRGVENSLSKSEIIFPQTLA